MIETIMDAYQAISDQTTALGLHPYHLGFIYILPLMVMGRHFSSRKNEDYTVREQLIDACWVLAWPVTLAGFLILPLLGLQFRFYDNVNFPIKVGIE